VIGSDLAGLIAATLCASRGLRVLLAEEGQPRHRYSLDGQELPCEPLLLTGLDRPACTRVIEELHFQHLLKRKIESLDPACQLLTPKIRLDCDPDLDRFAGELDREFGASAHWITQCMAISDLFDEAFRGTLSMPASGFFERRELSKIAGRANGKAAKWMESCPDETSQLCVMATAATSRGNAESPLVLARCMSQLLGGVQRLEGDYESLREILLSKFTSHGGEHRQIWPDRLLTSWGKVVGLRTIDGEEIGSDVTLYALPIADLLPLFGDKVPKKAQELARQTRKAAYRYTLNVLLHSEGIPEGMGNAAISMLDPDASPTSGNLLTLSLHPAQAGHSLLTASAVAPSDDDGEPDLRGLRDAVLAHLSEMMPFVGQHIEQVHSPHEPDGPGQKSNLDAPLKPLPIWETPVDDVLEQQSLPYSPGIKQLVLSNSQILPDLGLEGQFVVGWSAAKAANSALGKRRSSERKEMLSEG
jgi:hypothetical protein